MLPVFVVFVFDTLENLVPSGGPDFPELVVVLDFLPGGPDAPVPFLGTLNSNVFLGFILSSLKFAPLVVPKGVTLIGPTISG